MMMFFIQIWLFCQIHINSSIVPDNYRNNNLLAFLGTSDYFVSSAVAFGYDKNTCKKARVKNPKD